MTPHRRSSRIAGNTLGINHVDYENDPTGGYRIPRDAGKHDSVLKTQRDGSSTISAGGIIGTVANPALAARLAAAIAKSQAAPRTRA